MRRKWIERSVVLCCALLALSITDSRVKAQAQNVQFNSQQPNVLTMEGPAIHILVTSHLPHTELRKLVTGSRIARDHPDLAEYYRSKTHRLQKEAERYERLAHAFGDTVPRSGDSHFSVGRDAFHYHVLAKESFSQAQRDSLLAALYAQAAEGEGCFRCHRLHGRGGKIAPDLATEGTRGRSDTWLIGHFKDPQAYAPSSVMPALSGLTPRQLKTLATFLQYQKAK